jgi:peptidoglycan/xylan/chitin deacetylase (PgdA/CDA1 family)
MRIRRWLIRIGVGLIVLGVAAGWALPRMIPSVLAWLRPDIVFRGDSSRRILYLTIDDSPSAGTAEILKVLAKHHVPATFFVIEDRVHSADDLRAIAAAGQGIGNHTRTRVTWTRFGAEFERTAELLAPFPGPRMFRPHSGYCSAAQAEFARQRGFRTVLGTVYAFDPKIENPMVLKLLLRWLAVPGGILILHDGAPRAARTAAVLDELIPEFRRRGYEFARLDELAKPGAN